MMTPNLVAVLIAAAASFLIGWLWYSPMLFGNLYREEHGMSEADMKKAQSQGMSRGILLEIIGNVVMVFVLGWALLSLAVMNYGEALKVAGMLWIGFKLPNVLSRIAWEKKTWKTFILEGGYALIAMLAATAILFFLM